MKLINKPLIIPMLVHGSLFQTIRMVDHYVTSSGIVLHERIKTLILDNSNVMNCFIREILFILNDRTFLSPPALPNKHHRFF